MANPYTSAQTGGGVAAMIAPDIAVQQQQLNRQQQLADMLRQQSMENDGGTQVINGWAVQKSPFEDLAKLGQAYFGKQMQDGIDTKNAELSKALMGRLGEFVARGRPAASVPSTPASVPSTPQSSEPADPAALAAALSAPSTPTASAPAPTATPPAMPDPYSMDNLLRGQVIEQIGGNGAGNAYWKQYEPTEQQRNDLYLGISPTESRRLTLAARTRDGVLSLDPGKTAIMPDGTVRVAADFNNGISGGYTNGDLSQPTVTAVPGAAEAKAEMARAVKRSEAQVGDQGAVPTPVEIKTPTLVPGVGMVQPSTYMLSPSQQRAMANGGIDPLYPASPNARQMPGYPITGVTADQIIGSVRDPQQRSNVVSALGQPAATTPMQVPSSADLAADKAAAEARVTRDTKPGLDYATNAAQSFQKMGDNINNRLSESQALLQRINQSRDALARFQAGGGADVRAQLAQYAQAIPGMPTSVVDKIAGGDLSAVQDFQKFAAQEALQTMQQSLSSDSGPQAKGNRMAMELFIKNNPNITTDPRAIEKIFNFQTDLHNDALRQSDFYTDYLRKNQGTPGALDASAFANQWAHKQIEDGRVVPKQVTGEAKGTVGNPRVWDKTLNNGRGGFQP